MYGGDIMNKFKGFYHTKRVQKIAITILVIVVSVVGAAFAMFTLSESTPKTEVSITLSAKDIKDHAKIDIEVLINQSGEKLDTEKALTENVSITINEPTILKETLVSGTYEVQVTSSPIEIDGNIYRVPIDNTELVISEDDIKNKKTINIEIQLECIVTKDMTKGQLDDAIEHLKKEARKENEELIKILEKRKKTMVSDQSSKEENKQESKVSDTSKAEETPKEEVKQNQSSESTSNSDPTSNSSDHSPSNSATPPVNEHVHSWEPNMITIPEVPAQGYNEMIPAETKSVGYVIYADDCKIEITGDNAVLKDAMYQHDLSHGIINYRTDEETIIITPEQTRWVETSPAQPAYQKQDGYTCSCGAWKNK